jgi:TniQ
MIPTFPVDASLASIHTALTRVNAIDRPLQFSKRYFEECYQSAWRGIPRKIVSVLGLEGEDAVPELMRRHTLMLLYLNVDHRWIYSLRDVGWLSSGYTPKYCPHCAERDISVYGTPHWHLFHQVPGIHHCPLHGTLLHSACADCCSPLGRFASWNLPQDRCRVCNSRKTMSLRRVEFSDGYHEYVSYARRALVRDAGLCRWQHMVHIALEDGVESRDVEEALSKRWGVADWAELCHLLDLPGNGPIASFDLRAYHRFLPQRVALSACLLQLIPDIEVRVKAWRSTIKQRRLRPSAYLRAV